MRKRSLRVLLRQAVRQSDLTAWQKLRLGLVLIFEPEASALIEDWLIQGPIAEAGIAIDTSGVEPMFDLDKLERLLQILIEYLPQLIAIFEKFFPTVFAAQEPAV